LTVEDLELLVDVGGYVHPLFTHPTESTPFPGQALLLVCGGLVEQTPGLPSDILALVELTQVRFLSMATPPLSVRVRLDLHEARPTSRPDRVLHPMTWTWVSATNEHLTAEVLMLASSDSD
jgi:acyl dehydratase